jgi:Resolvase, N terminal domain
VPPSAKTVPKTAWTFLVVSSGEQEDTLTFQRSWSEEAARANGWRLTREFSGVSSGRDGERRLLRQLIDALDASDERPERVLMNRLTGWGAAWTSLRFRHFKTSTAEASPFTPVRMGTCRFAAQLT